MQNGIDVNARLEFQPNIYAAGDTARIFDLINEQPGRLPLWPLAGEQGLIAGRNMAAANPDSNRRYPGGISCNSFSLFGLDFISAGQRTFPPAVTDWEKSCQATPATYRRLNLQAGRLRGFILCGRPAILEAGPLYARIRREALATNPG